MSRAAYNPIVVVGLGGIGSHLVEPLARYVVAAWPEATLKLVDGDAYSLSNLSRQRAAESQIGGNKAEVQVELLRRAFPRLKAAAVAQFVHPRNVRDIVTEGSCVLACVDNYATRKILSDAVARLKNALLISGGNEYRDGNVQVYLREGGKNRTNPLDKFHPEIANPEDDNPADLSCEELETIPSGEQIIFTNLTAAALMLNAFYAVAGSGYVRYEEAYFDILDNVVTAPSRGRAGAATKVNPVSR
jgi:molybdopterin/thiamine biosynthesis adenylyltransferase